MCYTSAMLTVQPLADVAAIESVMSDPWVASRLRHDARAPGYIEHDALTYHGAYWESGLCGVFMEVRLSPWETEVHAALLKDATGLSHAFGYEFLTALWQNPLLRRITAPVVDTLPSARNYCLNLGFRLEGYRRDAVMIGGALHGIYQLGLTRDDWRRSLGMAA